VTIRPPEYKAPPSRIYTDIGWLCSALVGPVTFLAVWIYCAVNYGFLLGVFLGWIPALILGLFTAVAMIFLWPLAVVALLYVIYRFFGVHPGVLIYVGASAAIIAIGFIWWRHMARHNNTP
jgi:ABC-type dipeptide/oligopeptide/nickel transport system permease subunit